MKRFTVVIIALGIALSLFIFVGDRTADEPSSKVSTTTVFDEKQPNEMTVTVQSTAVTTSAPRSEEIKIRAKRIDVKKIVQFPELPTGCEITSLTMLLAYLGFDIDKVTLSRDFLPKMSFYTKNNVYYGADFTTTFAGDPEDPYSYGCYAPCIVTAANNYLKTQNTKLAAHDISGSELESLLTDYIDKDIPVLIWITSKNLQPSRPTSVWTTPEGKKVQWLSNEHCVVLTGYDLDKKIVHTADPMNTTEDYTSYDMGTLKQRYNELGKQCVRIG